jgi:hypothetical protein
MILPPSVFPGYCNQGKYKVSIDKRTSLLPSWFYQTGRGIIYSLCGKKLQKGAEFVKLSYE